MDAAMRSPRKQMRTLIMVVVAVVAMGTAQAPIAIASEQVGAGQAELSSGNLKWCNRAVQKFANHANARDWRWIARRTSPGHFGDGKKDMVREAKRVRRYSKFRKAGNCGRSGSTEGYCYFRNGEVLYLKLTKNGVRYTYLYAED